MMLRDTSPLARALALTAVIGALAGAIVLLGNPGNMGICGACFLRDIAGALGLFAGKGPKIFRPEVLGVVLGALGWMVARGKFVGRSGSYAVARFGLGVAMGVGALVFLGCPFRMLQRIGGGDLNAVVALGGFVPGVALGLFFEKRGYRVGRTQESPIAIGLLGPVLLIAVFALFVSGSLVGPGPGAGGPPAHAVWYAAFGLAAAAGVLMSATGFCAVSAARQVFLPQKRMLIAAVVFIAAYAAVVAAGGKFRLSFDGQPAAHGDHLWSVLSLALVGLAGALAGGCPVRQIVMTGEGNGDAFIAVAGILVGGALAHNLGLASSGAGTTPAGRIAVVAGLVLATAYAASVARAHARTDGA